MIRTSIGVLALALATSGRLAAQSDRWQVALDNGQYVWDVQLVRLDGDSLVVTQSDSLLRVPVEHITEIRLIRKTEVEGPNTAGAMNALTGGDDEIYDLAPLEYADRLRTVQKILLYHPTAP